MEIDEPRILPDQTTSVENMGMLETIRPLKPAGERCAALPHRQRAPKNAKERGTAL